MILYSYLFVRADYMWCHSELSYRSKGCNRVVPITCSSACKLVRYVHHSVASWSRYYLDSSNLQWSDCVGPVHRWIMCLWIATVWIRGSAFPWQTWFVLKLNETGVFWWWQKVCDSSLAYGQILKQWLYAVGFCSCSRWDWKIKLSLLAVSI